MTNSRPYYTLFCQRKKRMINSEYISYTLAKKNIYIYIYHPEAELSMVNTVIVWFIQLCSSWRVPIIKAATALTRIVTARLCGILMMVVVPLADASLLLFWWWQLRDGHVIPSNGYIFTGSGTTLTPIRLFFFLLLRYYGRCFGSQTLCVGFSDTSTIEVFS